MPRDIELRIRRAVQAGPDMRKPQSPSDMPLPPVGHTLAYLVRYCEVGVHETRTAGDTATLRDVVILAFELVAHLKDSVPPVDSPYPCLVSLHLDTGVNSFHALFTEMNFEQTSSHFAEMLGRSFVVDVVHRERANGRGYYASLPTTGPPPVAPARYRDEASGKVVEMQIPPRGARLRLFSWDTADADDWYDLYIPGEWPEWRDTRTGELLSPARSRNFIQEKIASAKNWPEHPLCKQVQIGPDPNAPTPEELQRQQERELKELQDRNWRSFKEALNRGKAESRGGKPLRSRAKRV